MFTKFLPSLSRYGHSAIQFHSKYPKKKPLNHQNLNPRNDWKRVNQEKIDRERSKSSMTGEVLRFDVDDSTTHERHRPKPRELAMEKNIKNQSDRISERKILRNLDVREMYGRTFPSEAVLTGVTGGETLKPPPRRLLGVRHHNQLILDSKSDPAEDPIRLKGYSPETDDSWTSKRTDTFFLFLL